MNPVYSRDKCVAVIRDFYEFLTSMFMDPTFIVEPPPGGWPSIDADAMRELGKTDEVVDLLRHLPYIANNVSAEGLPGCNFYKWTVAIDDLRADKTDAECISLFTEGCEDQFGAKLPGYCVGLVEMGLDRLDRDMYDYGEVIVVNTRDGIIHWMNCPPRVMETALPQSSWRIYPLEGNETSSVRSFSSKSSTSSLALSSTLSESDESDNESIEDANNDGDANQDDDESSENDEDDEDYSDDDDYDSDIQWGPCWPICNFFEMLKNQFRDMNFMAMSDCKVCDLWSIMDESKPPPQHFIDMMQDIYRKHGWPNPSTYKKDECLKEIKRALDEKFPEHQGFFSNDRA